MLVLKLWPVHQNNSVIYSLIRRYVIFHVNFNFNEKETKVCLDIFNMLNNLRLPGIFSAFLLTKSLNKIERFFKQNHNIFILPVRLF